MKNEHIEFDELYRLAEIEVQGEVYSEEEKKELQHLIECEECYERYCAAALSLAALDGINAEKLAIMAEKGDFEKAERKLAELGIDFSATETEKTLSGAPETEWARVDGRNSESVISITFRKVHDAIEAAAQQIKQVGTGFIFRSPVAVGGRGGAARGSTLKKLEDVENAYNCIVIDPALKRLTIQLDAAELETRQVKAYVVQKDGTMRNISLESDGDLLTGRIDGIVDECELHIETELCANGAYSGVLTEYMYSRSTFKQCLRGRRSLPAFCIIRKKAEQLCMKNGTVILACCPRFAQCGSSNSAKGRHRSGYRRLPH